MLVQNIEAVQSISQIAGSVASLESQHSLLGDKLGLALNNKCDHSKLFAKLDKQYDTLDLFRKCLIDRKRTREIKVRSKLKALGWRSKAQKIVRAVKAWRFNEKSFGSDFICRFVVNSQVKELSKQNTQTQLELRAIDSLKLTFTCAEKDHNVSVTKSGQGFDILNTLIKEINEDKRFPTTLSITNPKEMDYNSCKLFSEIQ